MMVKNSRSGFTLVEAMVAVILFSLLFGASMLIYLSGNESWHTNSVRLELQQEIRKGMSKVMDDLRQAGTSVVSINADGTWNPTISFRTVTGVSGGSASWSTNLITYSVSSDQLVRQVGLSTPGVVAIDIDSVQFRRQASTPDIVEVNLVAQGTTYRGRTLSISADFSIQLRNG
ncbi:MAG TPA: prepilin-type N-terminal cleavage/methylation domain-containing protein [Candidatus Omnitrophota bacterium]|nr:prepilin-type N-terminal cleavage/methylation domain-containing protein [Candidatus Omnitrophota bacterium]